MSYCHTEFCQNNAHDANECLLTMFVTRSLALKLTLRPHKHSRTFSFQGNYTLNPKQENKTKDLRQNQAKLMKAPKQTKGNKNM